MQQEEVIGGINDDRKIQNWGVFREEGPGNGLERTVKSKDTCSSSWPNGLTQFERENSCHFRKLEAVVMSSGESHASARTRR